jgi:hypothetical protein
MSSKSSHTTTASRVAEPGELNQHKKNLHEKIVDEIKKFVGLTIYLWVMFFLFSLHEFIVLYQYHISYEFWGLPLVNALVLAKVMLIADDLHLGERFKERPLIYPIVYKSIVFAVVFICFHIIEEYVIGVFKGKSIMESVASIGGGSLSGILAVAAIITLALSPFFAFRELGRVIGERELRDLLLTKRRQSPLD